MTVIERPGAVREPAAGAAVPGVYCNVAGAPEVDAPFATAVVGIGEARPDVVVLSADLSKYTDIAPFAQRFPDRFFQVGMAEQNMIGIAGGMAKSHLHPIAVTYCVFATRRAADQIQMALCTGGRPAVIAAFLPGITTPFRASHQGTDDLAIMRAVPGMTVIDPMDATEVAAALHAAVAADSPVYLRGLRGNVPRILPESYDFRIGAARLLRDGDDVGLVGTGLGSVWALEAAQRLEADGIRAAVLHVPTLKPFDIESIARFAQRHDQVLTVENHSVIGGLGSAVAEAIAEAGTRGRLHRCGVADRWGAVGPLDYVRKELGLDAEGIADRARQALGTESHVGAAH